MHGRVVNHQNERYGERGQGCDDRGDDYNCAGVLRLRQVVDAEHVGGHDCDCHGEGQHAASGRESPECPSSVVRVNGQVEAAPFVAHVDQLAGRVDMGEVDGEHGQERGEVVQQGDPGQNGGIVERVEGVQQKEDAQWIDNGEEQGQQRRVNVANVAQFEALSVWIPLQRTHTEQFAKSGRQSLHRYSLGMDGQGGVAWRGKWEVKRSVTRCPRRS